VCQDRASSDWDCEDKGCIKPPAHERRLFFGDSDIFIPQFDSTNRGMNSCETPIKSLCVSISINHVRVWRYDATLLTVSDTYQTIISPLLDYHSIIWVYLSLAREVFPDEVQVRFEIKKGTKVLVLETSRPCAERRPALPDLCLPFPYVTCAGTMVPRTHIDPSEPAIITT
jgi:hypothetical protein